MFIKNPQDSPCLRNGLTVVLRPDDCLSNRQEAAGLCGTYRFPQNLLQTFLPERENANRVNYPLFRGENFKVQVITRTATSAAHSCDLLPLLDLLAFAHQKLVFVAVKRQAAILVSDFNQIAVASLLKAGVGHSSRS